MSFLDLEDELPPALPTVVVDLPSDPVQRVESFQRAWSELTDDQKIYLTAFRDHNFRKQKALDSLGARAPSNTTTWRWEHNNEHFAFILKAMKTEIVSGILSKNNLVIRHNDLVEQMIEPKPILYQGSETGYYENQAPAAAKANETLLRVGGHLKEDTAIESMRGPALIVQVVAQDGTVQIAQVNNGIEVHPPIPQFLEVDDGET